MSLADAPAVVGEMEMLSEEPRMASVTATNRVKVNRGKLINIQRLSLTDHLKKYILKLVSKKLGFYENKNWDGLFLELGKSGPVRLGELTMFENQNYQIHKVGSSRKCNIDHDCGDNTMYKKMISWWIYICSLRQCRCTHSVISPNQCLDYSSYQCIRSGCYLQSSDIIFVMQAREVQYKSLRKLMASKVEIGFKVTWIVME